MRLWLAPLITGGASASRRSGRRRGVLPDSRPPRSTSRWRQAKKVPAGWTGDTKSCTIGTESQASIDATIGTVNAYRAFAGVKPVTGNPDFNHAALAAAMAMQAAGSLDHDIKPGSTCYSQDAADGASHSNLALDLGRESDRGLHGRGG